LYAEVKKTPTNQRQQQPNAAVKPNGNTNTEMYLYSEVTPRSERRPSQPATPTQAAKRHAPSSAQHASPSGGDVAAVYAEVVPRKERNQRSQPASSTTRNPATTLPASAVAAATANAPVRPSGPVTAAASGMLCLYAEVTPICHSAITSRTASPVNGLHVICSTTFSVGLVQVCRLHRRIKVLLFDIIVADDCHFKFSTRFHTQSNENVQVSVNSMCFISITPLVCLDRTNVSLTF